MAPTGNINSAKTGSKNFFSTARFSYVAVLPGGLIESDSLLLYSEINRIKIFSEAERGQIDSLYSLKLPNRATYERIIRSEDVSRNYSHLPERYNVRKQCKEGNE